MSVPRSVQRGGRLLAKCRKAKTTSREYGRDDDRVFCYGLEEVESAWMDADCRECGAWVHNARPPEGDDRA